MYMEGKYIFFFYIKESIWNSYRIQVEVVKKKKTKKANKICKITKSMLYQTNANKRQKEQQSKKYLKRQLPPKHATVSHF